MIYGRRKGKGSRQNITSIIDSKLPKFAINIEKISKISNLKALFPKNINEIWLEIGFGSGEHLIEQAKVNPKVGFIGIEVYEDGIAKAVSSIVKLGITNVKIYPNDANNLIYALPKMSIQKTFILFPDPWPKKRHSKRRFISSKNLKQLARIMTEGAQLRIATDHPVLLRWSLEQLINNQSFNWDLSGPESWRKQPSDWFSTRYENKAINAGRKPIYLNFYKELV